MVKTSAPVVRKDSQAEMEKTVIQDNQELQENQDPLESPLQETTRRRSRADSVPRDPVASRDTADHQDHQDFLDSLDRMEILEDPETTDQWDSPESLEEKVNLEKLGVQGRLEEMEFVDRKGRLVIRDRMDNPDKTDHQDGRDATETWDPRESRDHVESLEALEPMDSQDSVGTRDQMWVFFWADKGP